MELRVLYDVLKNDNCSAVVLQDCETAFNCRNIASKNQNYSVGATYFIKSNESAICNLERLAHQLFCHHTRGLSFDPSRSGAEWWTQVIDHRDDIGFHWDRDYGSEEEQGVHIHPLFGTVTYLSNNGGPTLILEKTGTPDATVPIVGTVSKFAASKPLFGKSIAFNGSHLHAAPSSLTEEDSDSDSEDSASKNSDGSASEAEEEEGTVKRMTFLVNIWIDHIPTQCIRFPKKEVKKMQPFIADLALDFKGVAPEQSKVSTVLSPDNCAVTRKWKFNNSDINYEVLVPLPDMKVTEKLMSDHDMLFFEYAPATDAASASKCIEIVYSEDQPSDSSDSGESEIDGSQEDSSDSNGSEGSDGEGNDGEGSGEEGSGSASDSSEQEAVEAGGASRDDAESSGEESPQQTAAKKRKL